LSRQRWTELLTNSPDLALRWMTSIARRLDDDRRRLVVVTSKSLLGQVAYLLLDLVEDGPGSQQVVKLSHTTVTHLLGARRQSVTRVMAEMKRRSPNCHALRRDREQNNPDSTGRSQDQDQEDGAGPTTTPQSVSSMWTLPQNATWSLILRASGKG